MDRIPTRPTGQRVLLVENHPINAAAMRSIFHRNGCNVRTANCAADAMVIHALEPFDFVVINTDMAQAQALSDHLMTSGKMRQQDVFAYAVKPTKGA